MRLDHHEKTSFREGTVAYLKKIAVVKVATFIRMCVLYCLKELIAGRLSQQELMELEKLDRDYGFDAIKHVAEKEQQSIENSAHKKKSPLDIFKTLVV